MPRAVRSGVRRPAARTETAMSCPAYFGVSTAKDRLCTPRRDVACATCSSSNGRAASGTLEALPEEVLDALVVVLDEIRLGRSRSRSELVARTGLGRAIVARRVQELLDRGLVSEGEIGPSTGGRPPRQLAFRGRTPGRSSSPTSGRPASPSRSPISPVESSGTTRSPPTSPTVPRSCLGRVEELFDAAAAHARSIPRSRSGASASAVPGPVEFATGRPISPPIMPGWDGYAIRERFAERFDAPVWVDNDVNVLALGEWRSGIAQGHDNVVVVKIGTGHRRRDHLRRAAPPGRAGKRRRRRPHPGRRRSVGGLPLRQRRLPRGARRRRSPRPPAARRRRAQGRSARLAAALDERGNGDRGGRRAGRGLRRPGRRRHAPGRRAGASATCSPASSTSSTRR